MIKASELLKLYQDMGVREAVDDVPMPTYTVEIMPIRRPASTPSTVPEIPPSVGQKSASAMPSSTKKRWIGAIDEYSMESYSEYAFT